MVETNPMLGSNPLAHFAVGFVTPDSRQTPMELDPPNMDQTQTDLAMDEDGISPDPLQQSDTMDSEPPSIEVLSQTSTLPSDTVDSDLTSTPTNSVTKKGGSVRNRTKAPPRSNTRFLFGFFPDPQERVDLFCLLVGIESGAECCYSQSLSNETIGFPPIL